ncbi:MULTISPECIES: sialidase family protein [Acidobacteriaceae]|uniref:sialidase family protein n=1 Tax=Acidobacteriaceae TaxID=204434 RepID=UPI00131AF5FE|nr:MULTISPECIES: sialidase family protein [Acidobacteriaceae]MDW5264284.1 sialidase family protein [Edaphobacter sp.]
MTRSISTNRLVAISLTIVAVLVIAFFLWRHTRPLIQTGHQAFVFEAHPHALGIEAKRPVVAATVTGGLYLLAVEDSALTLRMSHDSGEHWMPATSLSTPGNTVNTSAENAPQLVAHGMYAFALWQQKGAADQTQLVEARSTGMGTAPPLSTIVTDKPAADKSYSGFATLAVAPNGDVYAAWLDGRDNTSASTGTFNVYLARSTDRGATFHHNVKVATLACPCCRPSVAIAADGTVYVAYRHVYGDNERDIAVAASADHGAHFGPPVRVANDHWKLFGCPESGPVTAAQGNKLIVAWYTATGEHPGIRMAASHDGGQTFSKEISVSEGVENANHPYLSMADDGTIALVFSGRQATKGGDWNSLTPYALRIDTSGHVSDTTHVPADASGERYPTAGLSPDGDIYVVWSGTDATHASLIRGTSH